MIAILNRRSAINIYMIYPTVTHKTFLLKIVNTCVTA